MSVSSAAMRLDAPPEMTIRTCRKTDMAAIAGFRQDMRTELHRDDHASEGNVQLSEYFLIAEMDGEPVGYVWALQQAVEFAHDTATHAALTEDDHYLEVREVFVAPRVRHRGIGTRLVGTVLDRGRKNGIPRSMVCSRGEQTSQQVHFYERCGYAVSHVYLTR